MPTQNTNTSPTSTTSSRTPLYAFVAGFALALTLSLVFLVPTARSEAGTEPPDVQQPSASVELVAVQFEKTLYHQKRADLWTHRLGRHDDRAHKTLIPNLNLQFETKRTALWKVRADKAQALWEAERREKLLFARGNKDFHVALRLAVKQWGGSYSHLHACAHSEGHIDGYRYEGGRPLRYLGIDPFIMNRGGSGAGGWAQFMESTYNVYPQGRSMLPRQYRQWNDKLGQAFTMAYVFRVDGTSQWTGAGC